MKSLVRLTHGMPLCTWLQILSPQKTRNFLVTEQILACQKRLYSIMLVSIINYIVFCLSCPERCCISVDASLLYSRASVLSCRMKRTLCINLNKLVFSIKYYMHIILPFHSACNGSNKPTCE